MNNGLFLLVVWDDVSPEFYGPFDTDAERLEKARELRLLDDGDFKSGMYRIDAPGATELDADSFGYDELGE